MYCQRSARFRRQGVTRDWGHVGMTESEISRDIDVSVRVDQVGYTPNASKQCVLADAATDAFDVRRSPSEELEYEGEFVTPAGDF